MNFQQLRIFREAVRRNFNLTEVAGALFTSQSGVSKHMKDLEAELGVELFVRRGKRLVGLTGPGREMVPYVDRMLLDAQNLRTIATEYGGREDGALTIATTHTQARYALPRVVAAFRAACPRVHLGLYEAAPEQIAELLHEGRADIGIATEGLGDRESLAVFPFYEWHHAVIVPAGHPLERVQPLTLEAVAAYPLVTYREGFTGRERIDAAFAAAGLAPDFVLSAMDADVIRTYVELGLGVGILASMAAETTTGAGLRVLSGDNLFGRNTTWIAVSRDTYLRGYAYRFIELCDPSLDEARIRRESSSQSD
ncbi:MAG: CysB family HTH-type transcriptional regulator [Pseudomonadales bacterium]|nr:CysB family HTH-type transcriptional regulator [Pseudomonadales bacterium]